MSNDNCTDGHWRKEAHNIADHVGDAHESAGEVWSDVDVISLEATEAESIKADSDAKQSQNRFMLTAYEC